MNTALSFIIRKMPIIFGCCLVFTTVMALLPIPKIPDIFNFWDKAQHAVVFIVLTIMGCLAFPKKLKAVSLGLFMYGVSIELMQTFLTTTRFGEVSDLVADSIGIMFGYGTYFWASRFSIIRRLSNSS